MTLSLNSNSLIDYILISMQYLSFIAVFDKHCNFDTESSLTTMLNELMGIPYVNTVIITFQLYTGTLVARRVPLWVHRGWSSQEFY